MPEPAKRAPDPEDRRLVPQAKRRLNRDRGRILVCQCARNNGNPSWGPAHARKRHKANNYEPLSNPLLTQIKTSPEQPYCDLRRAPNLCER